MSLESRDTTCVGSLCERANGHGTRDFAGDTDLQAPFRNASKKALMFVLNWSLHIQRVPLLRVEWGYEYKYFCTTSIYPNVVLIFPLILAFENGPYFATPSLSLSLSADVTATWYGSYKCTHNTNGLLKFVKAYKLKALLPDFRPHMTDSKRISSDIN